ncbi:STAS domain-containing protein [Pseudonocardia sp. GCM10023141]|uniref:STAS domain-containing protein n=1 Tax=Pseudonocardia sp. GCM10023141 TaxID=3252653 RepID=UPI0036238C7C
MTGRDTHSGLDDPQTDRPGLELTTTVVGSATVVAVRGELDLYTAPELMSTVDAAFDQPAVATVVIDLSAVSFLGSSGLGVLANLATRAADARHAPTNLRLVAPPDHVAVTQPWEVMHLHQVLPLHPTVAAALES